MHDDPLLDRWLALGGRSTRPELLDLGGVEPGELACNLADLARLNRLPGGRRASFRAIRRLAGDVGRPRVLDVGTGGADLAVAFAAGGCEVVAVEPDPDVAAVARQAVRATGRAEVTVVEADGRNLPFDDDAFDVAHCSLLLHHLEPGAAAAVLREMGRVARRGVVVNDLRRGLLPLAAAAVAVTLLGRCRTTRHDGILSVRRAYRLDELDAILGAAGLALAHRSAAWMPRVVTVAVPRGAP